MTDAELQAALDKCGKGTAYLRSMIAEQLCAAYAAGRAERDELAQAVREMREAQKQRPRPQRGTYEEHALLKAEARVDAMVKEKP